MLHAVTRGCEIHCENKRLKFRSGPETRLYLGLYLVEVEHNATSVMPCPCTLSLPVFVCAHSPYPNPPVSNGICGVEQAEGLNTIA